MVRKTPLSEKESELRKAKRRRPKNLKYKPGRLREMLWGCYSLDSWERMFRGLPDRDKFDLLVRLEPKKIEVDSAVSVRLVIRGLGNNEEQIEGLAIPPAPLALPPGEDDWEDSVDAPAMLRARR